MRLSTTSIVYSHGDTCFALTRQCEFICHHGGSVRQAGCKLSAGTAAQMEMNVLGRKRMRRFQQHSPETDTGQDD